MNFISTLRTILSLDKLTALAYSFHAQDAKLCNWVGGYAQYTCVRLLEKSCLENLTKRIKHCIIS